MNYGFRAQQRRVEAEDSKWTPGTCILQGPEVSGSHPRPYSRSRILPGILPQSGCLGMVARHQCLLKLLDGSDPLSYYNFVLSFLWLSPFAFPVLPKIAVGL